MRQILVVLFAITLVIVVLFIIQEFFYAYRHNSRVQKYVPHWMIAFGIISFQEWELADTEQKYSEEFLEGIRYWMYNHSSKENEEMMNLFYNRYGVNPIVKEAKPSFLQRLSSRVTQVIPEEVDVIPLSANVAHVAPIGQENASTIRTKSYHEP